MTMANDILQYYVNSVSSKYAHEETSEMGYRTDFELLLKGIFESINVSRFDHDARAKQGNKPDFVVLKNDVPILYIETKDIGVSLDKIEKSEQMARYFGYANLVLTDYLEFRFYRNGLPYGEPIKIAEYSKSNRTLTPLPNNFDYLAKTLVDFTQSHKEPIKSGKHLSKIMGGKAQRIRDNVRQFLSTRSERNAELVRVYETIKKLLVHDLTEEAFADMYAQTLVYGLFVARFYDESPTSFSRQEARDLIPASNPLLRHFFDHIVGPNFDKRLEYIVNELCEVFSHADVEKLMSQYLEVSLKGKTHRKQDTVIHFYEDFLNEYDPILRKKMGAYYTPLPVVEFIVRSVDELLRKEFSLSKGLADTTKLSNGKHKVQVLDPAVGTGTFISAVIGEVYRKFKGQEGRWPTYVHNDLLPRIHGFELMMAPYTIAHLKLGLSFKKTGFKYFNRRLGIYLTNSLEQVPNQDGLFTAFGFAESIAEESKAAAVVKNETPIMVVVGNPPYSGISSNETEYANSLVERYKVEPGGEQKLQERKHWLNDDYVKFMAFAESMIDKTGYGVMAMITNNGYLDNPSFRGMRWHLAKTFDKIYLLNLHGDSKKKETTPSGKKDENVFDITQGVGIILALKTDKKRRGELGNIYYSDLYGTRKSKFEHLISKSHTWLKLTPDEEMVYFVPINTEGQDEYRQGFRIDELFLQNVTGIVTMGDDFAVTDSKEEIIKRVQKLCHGDYAETSLNNEFRLGKNYARFIIDNCDKLHFDQSKIVKIAYRPFDEKWTYFDNKVLWRWREQVSKHIAKTENLTIGFARSQKDGDFSAVFASRYIMEAKSTERSVQSSFAPLYLYHENGTKTSNLKTEIVDEIEKVVGKTNPEDIFDYIYAVLYSPGYREKYNNFLKLDFPRVPYPKDKKSFANLVKLGNKLRQLHLLESPIVNDYITTYPEAGSDTVDKPVYKDGNVFINETQYFGKVPEVAWSFWIGGYQPAQKWLKDRKGTTLTNSDIEHYQKMIVALTETDKVMKEIDKEIEI
jgi:predicted helicase